MALTDPLSLVGTTVSDKYDVEGVVGEGGFAIVYRAMHRVWRRPVALKVFRTLGDLTPARRHQLVESFIQEGRLLADLSERSAAIVQARDVGTLRALDGREMPYMVLEWLEGRALDDVLERERRMGLPPRTPEEALRLLEPAAEALALAHKKGIAHRDVKPANIFILGDPRGEFTVKLLDFGIAKVVQDAQRDTGAFAQTRGDVSSFTPAYGAPEQFSRSQGATGPWTDVFALALIYTEVLTHQAPLSGDNITQLAFASMDSKRRPTPRTYGAPVGDPLEAVMQRALAVTPDERFATMGDFWQALRRAMALDSGRTFASTTDPGARAASLAPRVGTVPLGPSGSMYPTRPAPPDVKSNSALLLVACLVMAVVGLGGIGVWAVKHKGAGPRAVASAPSVTASVVAPPPPPAPTCPKGMVKIPAGKFFMGSDDRQDEDNERPAHQVALGTYCMDETEVTVDQYKACSATGECKRAPRENEWEGIEPAQRKLYDPLCNGRDPDAKGNYPINCIDWELADAYCKATKRRLPTEAEWEYATRGSDGRKYPWGDDPPTTGDFLNACGKECIAWGKKHPDPDNPLAAMYAVDDGWPTTAPVGSFPKGSSPFGLKDVVGNVWEWVADYYAPYAPEPQTDPRATAGTERVIRGGAWNGSNVAWVRPTFRFKSNPALRSHGIGFRCALSL